MEQNIVIGTAGKKCGFVIFGGFGDTGNQNFHTITLKERFILSYDTERSSVILQIEKRYMDQALELHKTYPVVDAHLDLAGEILLRVKKGEKNPLRERYLEHFQQAGINLIVSSVFVENNQLPENGLRNALDQISVLLDAIDLNPEFMLVRTVEDLERAIRGEHIGIILYMEGLDCIGNDIKLLRNFWELGVRGASLTWSRRNMLASGCCLATRRDQIRGGLSDDGILAVKEMERLGVVTRFGTEVKELLFSEVKILLKQ